MTREDIIRLAREAWLNDSGANSFVRMAQLAFDAGGYAAGAAKEREACAQWMMARGYATGHGDSVADLLTELEWQVRERELKARAQLLIRQMAGLRMEAEQGERNEHLS